MIGRQPPADSRQLPARRVILLGASNLVRSFSTVVETVRQMWHEPVEIMAAIGHGRSFGQDSWVLGRKISGIFPCSLWEDLQRRRPLPTVALVTDIGNDLGYGVRADRLLEWVEGCLDRLAAVDAATIVTELPLANLESLSDARFRFFRSLLFPKSRLTLSAVRASAIAVNDGLTKFALRPKTSVIPVSKSWYGIDPVHLKRGAWRQAWPAILSASSTDPKLIVTPRASLMRWAYVRCLAPSERTVFGLRCRCEQPCGVLRDGTTISLY